MDGIIYFTVPDNVWAMDARSGHQIWRYTYPPNKGLHLGHRGVAMYKDSILLISPDAHLLSLDARNGNVRWNVEIGDLSKGYWSTMSPLVVGNHVIVGVGGDLDNIPGLPEVDRSRDRQDAMAMGQHAARRHSECHHRAA